jgi:hypothetical protein
MLFYIPPTKQIDEEKQSGKEEALCGYHLRSGETGHDWKEQYKDQQLKRVIPMGYFLPKIGHH